MTPPFSDAAVPEVCARVAYQLVRMRYFRTAETEPSPVSIIRGVVQDLPRAGFPIVTTALLGMQYALLTKKRSSAEWRRHAIIASRAGCGFRQCYYDDYKAHRRR